MAAVEEMVAGKFTAIAPHLDERGRRMWLGVEARALGRGGVSTVARATGTSRTTVSKAVKELSDPDARAGSGRARRAGAGRPRLTETDPGLVAALEALVDPDTRGDPQSPLRWTRKSTRTLADTLSGKGHAVSSWTVAKLLHELGYSLQANVKTREGASHPDRDAQFRLLGAQVQAQLGEGGPVVSVDTKKKELSVNRLSTPKADIVNAQGGPVERVFTGARRAEPSIEGRLMVGDRLLQNTLGRVCTFHEYMLQYGMAHGYLRLDRDQQYLLPPDVREWLPPDRLAWAVLDAVDQLDLSELERAHRADGKGRAAYPPKVMAAVLLYAYCLGVYSSRQIERRCSEDVGFRVITANRVIDHTTIARFRAAHDEAIKALHTKVLALMAEAGMVKVGIVAVDSTKMAANASKKSYRRYEDIAEQVNKMHAEAAATDQAEDRLPGDDDADSQRLPEELRDRTHRRERFAAAKRRLEEEAAAEHAAWQRRQAAREEAEAAGKKPRGRPRKHPDVEPVPEGRKASTTDPDSAMLKCPGGYVQGYSAQTISTEDGIVLATQVTNEQNDANWLHPMLDAAQDQLGRAGIADGIDVLLADAGYWSDDNVTAAAEDDPKLLIATGAGRKLGRHAAEGTAPDPAGQHRRSETAQKMTKGWPATRVARCTASVATRSSPCLATSSTTTTGGGSPAAGRPPVTPSGR